MSTDPPPSTRARPLRPSPPPSSPPGPQPLADRDRRRGRLSVGRRWIAAIAVGAGLALMAPITITALGPAAAPLRPLGGQAAGAGSVAIGPLVAASAAPSATKPGATAPATPARIDPAAVPPRATDPDGPPPVARRNPTPVAYLTGYAWPIRAGRVSLPFKEIPGGSRIREGKRFHDGVDMASFCGARVGAAHAGVVLAAGRRFDDHIGWLGDLGPYYRLLDRRRLWSDLPIVVVIDDENGYRSIYAHFREVTVKPGQRVRAGQLIGYEGATGHASGCHVHYGLFSPLETRTFGIRPDIVRRLKVPRHEIARVDPLLVLPRGEVALRTRQIALAVKAAAADATRP